MSIAPPTPTPFEPFFYLLQNLTLTIIAEQLGPDFIAFILDLIENPPDMDLEDQIPDLFVNLILSYNLQFTNSENIVLNALKERTVAKNFTEKILLLFNREGERKRDKAYFTQDKSKFQRTCDPLQRILCEYSIMNHRRRILY